MLLSRCTLLTLSLAVASMMACSSAKQGNGGKQRNLVGPGGKSVGVVKKDKAAEDFQKEMDVVKAMKPGDGYYSEVADRMQSHTSKHPRHALGWLNLGIANHRLGDKKKAKGAYKKALEINPKQREAVNNLAALAAEEGDNSTAYRILSDLVGMDPGAWRARVALASHYLARGEMDEAAELCKQSLAYEPTNPGAYCVMTEIAVKRKKFGRARLLAGQGYKVDKESPCIHFQLGKVALAEGETALAIVEFERAVSKDPSLVVLDPSSRFGWHAAFGNLNAARRWSVTMNDESP